MQSAMRTITVTSIIIIYLQIFVKLGLKRHFDQLNLFCLIIFILNREKLNITNINEFYELIQTDSNEFI